MTAERYEPGKAGMPMASYTWGPPSPGFPDNHLKLHYGIEAKAVNRLWGF